MVFTSQVLSKPFHRPVQTPAAQVSISVALGLEQATYSKEPLHASADTHQFFLPTRNFFFMKTKDFRGTQISRAMEVT